MKNFIKNFRIIKWFLDIRRELSLIRYQLTLQTKILQENHKEILKSNISKKKVSSHTTMNIKPFLKMAGRYYSRSI